MVFEVDDYKLQTKNYPLVVIVGETASGKSQLALELAECFDGEIICADSRTVYKGMDIGTAKPTKQQQAKIRHHVLDVVEPNQDFTVVNFKELANQVITDIQNRGKLPILVGGSGLYIDAVLFDYQFSKLGAKRDYQNPRHLQRSAKQPTKQELRPNTLIIGLSVPRDLLQQRIAQRVEVMIDRGFVKEVKTISQKYGWQVKALDAPGYRAFQKYLAGEMTLEEAGALFVKNDLNLAKKQRTWFKRNKSIHWTSDLKESVDLVTTFLNKKR